MSSIASSMADRPPPDPVRLLAALDAWVSGDFTAGTTMQSLKRGGLDELLAATSESDADAEAARTREVWLAWEKGKAKPGDTLIALEAAGIREVLQRQQP
jgi:hypothetical protein